MNIILYLHKFCLNRFVYSKIPKSKSKEVKDGIDVFKFMMQRGDLKSTKLEELKQYLNAVRPDLTDVLTAFQGNFYVDSY